MAKSSSYDAYEFLVSKDDGKPKARKYFVDRLMECLEITADEYRTTEKLDYDLVNKEISLDAFDFKTLQKVKRLYVKCQLLHMILYKSFRDELNMKEELTYYYDKTKKHFSNADVRVVPDRLRTKEQVLDYLMSYKFEWLVCVGW